MNTKCRVADCQSSWYIQLPFGFKGLTIMKNAQDLLTVETIPRQSRIWKIKLKNNIYKNSKLLKTKTKNTSYNSTGIVAVLISSSSSLARQPYVSSGLPQKLLLAKVSGYCFFRFRDKSLFQGGVVSPTPNPRLSWRVHVFCQGCLP
jgi:hypothetical protein